MQTSDWISGAAVIISVLTAAGSAYGWRHSKFRYGEVLAWSLEAIRAMQRLYVLTRRELAAETPPGTDGPIWEREVADLAASLSVLVEQGRVFFKNTPGQGALRDWGREKPPAYRGIRPKILDYLVACHDAAIEWKNATAPRRRDLVDAVLEAERQFVSLAQSEVGRARTLSVQARQAGSGSPLIWILRDLRLREAEVGDRQSR